VIARRLERHTEPGPRGYRSVAYAEAGQQRDSTVVPGLSFSTDELFGPAALDDQRRSPAAPRADPIGSSLAGFGQTCPKRRSIAVPVAAELATGRHRR
jgi:hypothetical protein